VVARIRRGVTCIPEKANSVPPSQASVIWDRPIQSKVENAVMTKFMENMTPPCVSPLKSECTFYQSEIFSEQKYREALPTAIGDRVN
jgi:hypothetical protein